MHNGKTDCVDYKYCEKCQTVTEHVKGGCTEHTNRSVERLLKFREAINEE